MATLRPFTPPLIVVIDGPNRVGKSTLIANLQRTFGFDYVMKGNAPSSPEAAEINTWNMLVWMAATQKHFLFDRFYYPTDLIYRRALESKPSYFLEKYESGIQRLLHLMRVFYVFLDAPDSVLIERNAASDPHWHIGRGDMIPQIAELYRNLSANFALPHCIVSTDQPPAQTQIEVERHLHLHYAQVLDTAHDTDRLVPGKVSQLK